jgi:hypothetical protein
MHTQQRVTNAIANVLERDSTGNQEPACDKADPEQIGVALRVVTDVRIDQSTGDLVVCEVVIRLPPGAFVRRDRAVMRHKVH